MKLEVRRELLQIVQFDSFVLTHALAAVIRKSILLKNGKASKRIQYLSLYVSGGVGSR